MNNTGGKQSGGTIIALGGNAIVESGEEGNLQQQYKNTNRTIRNIVAALQFQLQGPLVLTHGNGPQVGNILFRSEFASKQLYPLTLDVCVSDSEGGMGYMIQQILHNELVNQGFIRDVVTLITQTVVDRYDPAFKYPSKFIGRAHSEEEAKRLMNEQGWLMQEDVGRGWRRVVPSPDPIEVVETRIIRNLIDDNIIVIAAGGGGIPVILDAEGQLGGVEAVVDKDLASALLGIVLGLKRFIIVTGVDCVYLNYGKANQEPLREIKVSRLRDLFDSGIFPEGSMGPKIEASLKFLEGGGEEVLITRSGCLLEALSGETGTRVLPD